MRTSTLIFSGSANLKYLNLNNSCYKAVDYQIINNERVRKPFMYGYASIWEKISNNFGNLRSENHVVSYIFVPIQFNYISLLRIK